MKLQVAIMAIFFYIFQIAKTFAVVLILLVWWSVLVMDNT